MTEVDQVISTKVPVTKGASCDHMQDLCLEQEIEERGSGKAAQ
jgi:hypothetical protein